MTISARRAGVTVLNNPHRQSRRDIDNRIFLLHPTTTTASKNSKNSTRIQFKSGSNTPGSSAFCSAIYQKFHPPLPVTTSSREVHNQGNNTSSSFSAVLANMSFSEEGASIMGKFLSLASALQGGHRLSRIPANCLESASSFDFARREGSHVGPKVPNRVYPPHHPFLSVKVQKWRMRANTRVMMMKV